MRISDWSSDVCSSDLDVGVGVARQPAIPDVYAALARRRGLLRADGDEGRVPGRAAEVRPGRGAPHHRGAADHRDHAGAVDALRPARPTGLADPRPTHTGDRLLRGVRAPTRAPAGVNRPRERTRVREG